ncbi:DNA sulfur modification protein DndB [Actinosynnema sp. NPDC059797]
MQGLVEHDTLDAAFRAASEAAISGFGRVFPCMVFTQGRRTMLSTSFPMRFVASPAVVSTPATKETSAQEAMNRPLMADHVKAINQYLLDNHDQYILPPVTLSIREVPAIHVSKDAFKMRLGYMVVDDSSRFYVTDGQHRINAIRGLGSGRSAVSSILDSDLGFENDGLAVLIVVEPDIQNIHQDFADAAQTKQIPPSLLAAYNTRAPINRVLTGIVRGSKFFNGRIDDTSKTLPKMSQSIFLLNQVRGMVKELLVRDYAMAEESLARSITNTLDSREKQDVFIAQALQLLDVLTEHMHPWVEIAELDLNGSGVANKIPEFRRDYINMTATGLVLIGRAAYEINKFKDEAVRLAKYEELATKVDWRRDAPIWQGNIIISNPENTDEPGKIVTLRRAVNMAGDRVLDVIGLKRD